MKHSFSWIFLAASFAAACLFGAWPTQSHAQPLADRVPGDAMIYWGFKGLENMGPGFDQSRFKAVLDASEAAKFMSEFVPAMMAAEARDNPSDAARLEMLGVLLPTIYKRGGAVFVAQPIMSGNEVTPRLGMMVDAGPDADALEAKLKASIEANKAKAIAGSKSRVTRIGTLVVALFGYGEKDAAVAGQGGLPSLGEEVSFKASLKQVHEKPVLALYVNSEELIKLVDKMFKARGETGASARQAQAAIDAMGIRSVKRAVMTGAFEGREWVARAFVESPAPRAGLASMLDCGPVSDEFLSVVPASAESMIAGRFDAGKWFAETRMAAAKILASMSPPKQGARPEDAQNQALVTVDNAIVQIATMTGIDLKTDLFDALGEQWVVFSDRSIGGGGDLGKVLINKPKHPAKLERALSTIGQIAPGFIAMQMPAIKGVQVRQIALGKDVIRYVDSAPVSPAWLIKDGTLYVAAFPQVILDAVAAIEKKGPAITANKDYLAMRKQLSAEKATGVMFMDLPQTADRGYPFLLAGARMMLAQGARRGVVGPAMLVPSFSKIKSELSICGAVTWADNAGWHMAATMPFPAAPLLSTQAVGLIGALCREQPGAATLPVDNGETWETAPATTSPKGK